jgi:hypothetical protein
VGGMAVGLWDPGTVEGAGGLGWRVLWLDAMAWPTCCGFLVTWAIVVMCVWEGGRRMQTTSPHRLPCSLAPMAGSHCDRNCLHSGHIFHAPDSTSCSVS